MSCADKAVGLFSGGCNCSQAVLAACSQGRGLDEAAALRVASGFGGGIGQRGESCGALTGGLMALGLALGHDRTAGPEAKQRTYGLVREYIHRFQTRHGFTDCRDLLGLDLSTDEGRQLAKERNTHANVCPKFVRTAAEVFEQMVAEAKQK
ncbi:MAG: hypothetical protein BIFFINMI_03536 [Phycisphaerae bacterium]|nr:hypothetical protein [Phycisphaerae bacterium]